MYLMYVCMLRRLCLYVRYVCMLCSVLSAYMLCMNARMRVRMYDMFVSRLCTYAIHSFYLWLLCFYIVSTLCMHLRYVIICLIFMYVMHVCYVCMYVCRLCLYVRMYGMSVCMYAMYVMYV